MNHPNNKKLIGALSLSLLVIVSLVSYAFSNNSNGSVSASYNAPIDAALVNTDSTHQWATDALMALWNGKQDAITTGTTSQYLDGTLHLQTMAVAAPFSFNMAPSRTIQTVAASANGWQLSTTRNSMVTYSVNTTTTATIGGASDGYVVMEISPTNSTSAASWQEVARSRNGQNITLAITLNSIQNIGSQIMGVVPAGYYVRLRSVNTSGTPVYTYISGEELLL